MPVSGRTRHDLRGFVWIVELDAASDEAVFRGEISDGAITLPYSYLVPGSD